jgi:hypothetical protein
MVWLMPRVAYCFADERIPWGALVLVRGKRCCAADAGIANGRLRERERLDQGDTCKIGAHVSVEMLDGLGSRSLHDLANGPCMNALQIYLPAGKLSMAETLERERQAMREANSPS